MYRALHRVSLTAALLVLTVRALVGMTAPRVAAASSDDQKLSLLKSRASTEIDRRLTRLSALSSTISGAARLTSGDKSSLQAEVTSEVNGLTSLKSQIAGDTDLQTARINAQSVLTDYRVYALVVPKVWLVRVADDQQAVENKLNTLSGKLQTRINEAQNNGKTVTALQNSLNDMQTNTQAAQKISAPVEQALLPMQPTDYNNDHTLLTGYRTKLTTAHNDNKAAYSDAKTIVQGLKN